MNRTKGELLRFLFVGGTTVAIDFLIYRSLLWIGLDVSWAKGTGFIAGTVFSYFANKAWTFQVSNQNNRMIFMFLLVYTVNLGVNVGTNHGLVELLGRTEYTLWIAFLGATGLSSSLIFLGGSRPK